MKKINTVLLMQNEAYEKTRTIARDAGVSLSSLRIRNRNELEKAFEHKQELLLSFGSGLIVPKHILNHKGLLAFNIHGASPDYPGRDPHHFAVYDDSTQYGATMHYMTANVDEGPIVDVELFDVPKGITPFELLNMANNAGWLIIRRLFNCLFNNEIPEIKKDLSWGKRKTTRKMFLDLCRVDHGMSKEEVERRLRATAMPGYKNLYIDLYGHKFYIEN